MLKIEILERYSAESLKKFSYLRFNIVLSNLCNLSLIIDDIKLVIQKRHNRK